MNGVGDVVGRTDGWRLTIGDVQFARFRQQRKHLLFVPHWVIETTEQRLLVLFWRGRWADDPRVFHPRSWHLTFELETDVAARQLALASLSTIHWEWRTSD